MTRHIWPALARLHATAILLYCRLRAATTPDDRRLDGGYDALARATDLGARTIQRHLTALADAGLVVVERTPSGLVVEVVTPDRPGEASTPDQASAPAPSVDPLTVARLTERVSVLEREAQQMRAVVASLRRSIKG